MIVKINSRGQVTLPAHVLEAMAVGPGDRLVVEERPDGILLKPSRIDHRRLGVLRDLIPPDAPPFDIREFRDGTYDSSLRD